MIRDWGAPGNLCAYIQQNSYGVIIYREIFIVLYTHDHPHTLCFVTWFGSPSATMMPIGFESRASSARVLCAPDLS